MTIEIVDELNQIHEMCKVPFNQKLKLDIETVEHIEASHARIIEAIGDRKIIPRLQEMATVDNANSIESAIELLESGSINTAIYVIIKSF